LTFISRIFYRSEPEPAIQVSTDSLDFGDGGVDMTSVRVLTVESIGSGTPTIDSAVID